MLYARVVGGMTGSSWDSGYPFPTAQMSTESDSDDLPARAIDLPSGQSGQRGQCMSVLCSNLAKHHPHCPLPEILIVRCDGIRGLMYAFA